MPLATDMLQRALLSVDAAQRSWDPHNTAKHPPFAEILGTLRLLCAISTIRHGPESSIR